MTTDEKVALHGFQRVDWGDHKFAAWLRSKDPKWSYESFAYPPGTYWKAHGKTVAITFYDNPKSTHKTYVKQDEL